MNRRRHACMCVCKCAHAFAVHTQQQASALTRQRAHAHTCMPSQQQRASSLQRVRVSREHFDAAMQEVNSYRPCHAVYPFQHLLALNRPFDTVYCLQDVGTHGPWHKTSCKVVAAGDTAAKQRWWKGEGESGVPEARFADFQASVDEMLQVRSTYPLPAPSLVGGSPYACALNVACQQVFAML